jgi:RimJ/RimL family protein N-acetyltransferase
MAPILTTPRLTLAPHDPADLPAFAAMWSDPAVYGPLGGHGFTREEVWHRMLRYTGHWQLVGYGNWAVRETATGRIVGEIGLMDSRRATVPMFEGTPEMGWVLCSWAHGRGFAREGLEAALAWSDAQGIARTVCIIDPANAPSIKACRQGGLHAGGRGDLPRRAQPVVRTIEVVAPELPSLEGRGAERWPTPR